MPPLATEPWSLHASGWSQVGPPLRPSPEDLQRVQIAWADSLPGGIPARRLDILSLGVTPETALFPWAPDFDLTAIDRNREMIRAVWPGDEPNRRAVAGNWLRMPFAKASFDLILSDFAFGMLVGADQLLGLAVELRRVLRPDGRVVTRHFARPAQPESVDAIAQAAGAAQMRNFHELKLRLLMAIESKTPETGVRLSEVHDCFQRLFPDRALLASRLGCDLRTVSTIDVYRGLDARYAFHSLAEVARAFHDFHLAKGPAGQYPSAELCPVFSLAPKP